MQRTNKSTPAPRGYKLVFASGKTRIYKRGNNYKAVLDYNRVVNAADVFRVNQQIESLRSEDQRRG
jgi:hypothetical protein